MEREEFERLFRSVMAHLEPLAAEDRIRWHDLMWFVLSWAFRRRPSEENAELKGLAAETHQERQLRQEIEKMSRTTWISAEQEVFQKGRGKGLEEGRQKGLEEGLETGAVEMLRESVKTLLEYRFGTLPEETLRRIASTGDCQRLQALMIQTIDAASLDDLRWES